MKSLIATTVTAAAMLTTSVAFADFTPGPIPASPSSTVFDAQVNATLHNIDSRLAEMNQKLSGPQVPGCSDGEHVYTEGMSVTMRNGFSYRCDFTDGRYIWTNATLYK
ncbi:hypothetical protein [Erwinia mallotivora]|uniref:hypothetical protein n=1 Tax=Erwinia mallotivora TaxID=69222 RepID=UPI0021C11DE7|nr:hypothetical protein [Erwinia mallotivora]